MPFHAPASNALGEPPARRERFLRELPGCLAVALVALCFAPTLGGPFLADDYVLMPFVRDGGPLAGFFGAQGDSRLVAFYRPLLMLTFWVDDAAWGGDPFGARLTNLVLHLATVWLLWKWARALGASTTTAVATSLAWGLSVAAPGDVAWIAGRCDSQSILLVVGASYCAWRGRGSSAFALAVAAALTKETGYAALLVVPAFLARRAEWRVRAPVIALVILASLFVVRRLVLGVWIGGYLGGVGLVPGVDHFRGLGAIVGHALVPNLPSVGLGLFGLVCVLVFLWPNRDARWLLGAAAAAAAPLAQQWRAGDGPGVMRLYGLPLAFLCLVVAIVGTHAARRSAWVGLAVVLWAANAIGSGGLAGIADYRAAGEQIRRSDEAVAAALGEPADLLLLAGAKRLVGSAHAQTIGVHARYRAMFPDGPPVWPMHQVVAAGRAWRRPVREQPEIVPMRFDAGLIGLEGPREYELTAADLRAMASERETVRWSVDAASDLHALLLTPAGQNLVPLDTMQPSLRDIVLARYERPSPGAPPTRQGARLINTLTAVVDGGLREAWLLFCDRTGRRSPAIALRFADDVVDVLLPQR